MMSPEAHEGLLMLIGELRVQIGQQQAYIAAQDQRIAALEAEHPPVREVEFIDVALDGEALAEHARAMANGGG